MAEVKGLEPQTMFIRYDKFDIIAMPIGTDAILLILCEPGCNTALISTTACMLGPEIKKSLSNKQANVKSQVSETPKNSNQTYINKQTSHALKDIKDALFDTVGPVADMVYDECLERWTANNPPDINRIFELIGCISGEIDNPELFDEFKGKINSLL